MPTPVHLCVLASLLKLPIVYICHCPFPSRCACDLLPFSETSPHFDHMDLPSSLNSAFCDARTSVGEPAQGVGSGGLFTVVLF